MEYATIENKLRELLLPVLGYDSINEIHPGDSLVHDLGAESLDFVELMYLVEREFGVALKTGEIVLAGGRLTEQDIFQDDLLSAGGSEILKTQFPDHADKIQEGMHRFAMFSLVTVGDLARIIHWKIKERGEHAQG